MKKRRLFWPIFASYLLLILMVTVAYQILFWWRSGRFETPVLLSGLGVLIFGGLVAALLSARMVAPLARIGDALRRFGRGDLTEKLPASSTEELNVVIDAVNRMAEQLASRLEELTNQRNETDAVLESLHEGVLAMDQHERIMGINRAAKAWLDLPPDQKAQGRLLQEVIRHAELQRYLKSMLKGDPEPEEGKIIRVNQNMVLRCQSAPLRKANNGVIGVVVILANVTRIRELENLQRDFVANVSHELRTPITSIKGYAETLLDGALEDVETAAKFADIIVKQSDRLTEIIEDLLRLSRLDKAEDIERQECGVRELVGEVIKSRQSNAAENSVTLTMDGCVDCRFRANRRLLDQAITNLIDNAIKYSGSGTEIKVTATCEEKDLVLVVKDNGPGIAAEHLPRLFDRFYRIDRARSRDMGGTGLGLSIVKHIAQAHGGTVSVESKVGEGSAFSIHLPKAMTCANSRNSNKTPIKA